ncbi:MAG: hypothetical protein E6Q88_10790, partial [Lysobacteraceae bacterium]
MSVIIDFTRKAIRALGNAIVWLVAIAIPGAPFLFETFSLRGTTHSLAFPTIYVLIGGLLLFFASDDMNRFRLWRQGGGVTRRFCRYLMGACLFFAIAGFEIFFLFDKSMFAQILLFVCVAAFILWLVSTRNGHLTIETARIGISSLPRRAGASAVVVIGIAGVVAVLVAMLAMGEGFAATLKGTGNDTSAIILRGGAQAETNSVITRDQVPLISNLAGIARGPDGRAAISPELSQVVNMTTKADGTDANAQLRGVGDAAWTPRPQIKIVEGRKFEAG